MTRLENVNQGEGYSFTYWFCDCNVIASSKRMGGKFLKVFATKVNQIMDNFIVHY